jgi:hypothetical protein
VAIKSRVAKDVRSISRIAARLNCQLMHEGNKFEAVVLDISLNGAFLSSTHLPPTGSTVAIALKPPTSNHDLTLEGKVIRGTWAMSDHGKLGRFGIRFSHNSLDLIKLIGSLNK